MYEETVPNEVKLASCQWSFCSSPKTISQRGINNIYNRHNFEKLLNEEYPKEVVENIPWNKYLMDIISKKEAVRMMKKKKVVQPDEVSVEVWKMLEYVDIRWLKNLFNKVILEGKENYLY